MYHLLCQIIFSGSLLLFSLNAVDAAPVRVGKLLWRSNAKRTYQYATVYQEVLHIVAATKTVWVDPPTTEPTVVVAMTTSAPVLAVPSSTPEPSPAAVDPSPTPLLVEITPTPTPTPTPPIASVAAAAPPTTAVPLAVEATPSPTPTPDYTETEAPTATEPAPALVETTSADAAETPSQAAAAAQPSSTAGSSTSGGGDYTGEATYYSPSVGYGSCGLISSDSEMVVALAQPLMVSEWAGNPNHNPYCGKRIKGFANGNSFEATVVDTCPGCLKMYDIDLSPAAFNSIAPEEVGRVVVTWSFIEG